MAPINLIGLKTRTGRCKDEFRGKQNPLTWGDFNQYLQPPARPVRF
jgi:hypothetical protein